MFKNSYNTGILLVDVKIEFDDIINVICYRMTMIYDTILVVFKDVVVVLLLCGL